MAPFSPPRVIVAGPPASGKSTQCKFISDYFGAVYISSADVLADAISSESELGQAAQAFINNDQPVPHDIYTSLVSERIKDEDCVKLGWVLDGFPCTPQELELFQTLELTCDAFVFLDVPSTVLIDRTGGRRRDPDTSAVYHMNSLPENLDDDIVARLRQDEEDSERVMTQRINDYFGEMHEVLNYFHDKLMHINGNRGMVFVKDEILSRLRRVAFRTVIFVVGGPGSGKRTHCNMIATNQGYVHLCPKELINQEQYFDSDISNKIDRITSRGGDIPARIIVELLAAAMMKAESNNFIIDSFPRNVEDFRCWYEMMSGECVVDFVIHLDCPTSVVIDRTVTKKDPNIQSVASSSSVTKKHKQFCEDTLPFVNMIKLFGRARRITTIPPVPVVNKTLTRIISSLSTIPPYDRSLCIIKPDAVRNGNVPDILTAINDSNLAIVFTKFVTMTADVVDDFFSTSPEFKSKNFKKHRDFLKSGASLLIVVEGSNAIRRLHDLVGSEKNYKSQSTTLRCRFGTDSIRNGFYCSTDEYNAIRDIYYWLCPNDIAAAVVPESNSRQYTLEDTVALIKPTFAESCYDEIMAIIAGHGFQVISECRFNLTSELLTELYPEMKPDNKFSKVREYMLSGPVVALQLRRDAALKGWRHLVGCIDMKKNQEERHDSIRFKYAVNSIENAVHGSYNSLMASKELSLFFPMLDVCDKGFSTSSSKLDKPKTAKRKKKKQTTTISNSKQSELHSYLSQDVNPVLNELVRNLAIQKPKDIMGYAIKDLIEKQKLDALKIGPKNRMSSSSTLPVLPDICHDHHSSSEKGVMDGLYMNKEKSDIDIVSLDAARSEVARLQETIRSISANLVENSESKNSTHINETLHVEANNALNSNRTIDVLSIGDLVGFGNSHSSILEGNAIASFSGALKSVQQRTGAMVLFTGGFLGCAHTIDSTHYSSMITLIDNLGVNYGILGTRDFEFGWDDVHNHLKFSHVTWIASNIVKPETGKPFKNCEEKVLVEWKGIQVGLIGLIDDWVSDVPSYSSSASNVKVLDPLEAAKRLCAELKDEGAEVILILSHCVSKEINEKLSALPDVQIVVSGHANGFESWKLNDSSLGVANGGLGGISSVSIAVSDSRLPVVAWPPGYIVVTTERQPYDIVDSIVSNLREESDSALATKLGTITSTELQCSKQRVRTSETPLGNLLTDMMRRQMKTDIAVLNAGAIHSDCSLGPGLITIDDISNSLPHDDYVASVTISGEQIMDMLNNSVSRAPSADGRFLQVSGISFEYKVETTDRERCFNVMVQDQVLDLKQFYTCAMTGWLLNMHDGYKCFKGVSVPLSNEFFPSIMQVVLNYFDKRMLSKADRYHRDLTEDDFDPVDTEIEGRIVLTDANVSAGYHESVTTLGRVRSSSSHDSLNSDDAVNQNGANEYQNDDDDVKEEEGVDYGAHDVLSSKF